MGRSRLVEGPGRWLARLGVAALLLGLVFVLHGSALKAGWRSDDGALLGAAALFSPSQYFFVPSITNLVSASSHVTPWNVLVYDINLQLFGLAVQWYYAHALCSLWVASILVYVCAGLWMPRTWALGAAILFVASSPAVHMAQQLMVGHYLEGLIFSLSAVALHFTGQRKHQGMPYAILAAACYALSTACKEVYVPLVCLLPWIAPAGTRLRQRILCALPAAAVAAAYVGWRYLVLGRLLGGYVESTFPTFPQLASAGSGIPALLFGISAWSSVSKVLALTIIAAGLALRASRLIVLLSLFALLLPLLPLVVFPGIALRFLFVPWAAFCVLTCFVLSHATREVRPRVSITAIGVLAILGLVSLMQARSETGLLTEASRPMESQAKFLLQREGPHPTYLLPDPRAGSPRYQDLCLSGLTYASRTLRGRSASQARILSDPLQLQLAANGGQTVYTYDSACDCMRTLSVSEIQDRLRAMGGPFPLSSDALAFRYRFDQIAGKLVLEIDSLRSGKYLLHMETILGNSIVIPITSNNSAFSLGSPPYSYRPRFEIWHLDSEMRLIASPSLDYSVAANNDLMWDSTLAMQDSRSQAPLVR